MCLAIVCEEFVSRKWRSEGRSAVEPGAPEFWDGTSGWFVVSMGGGGLVVKVCRPLWCMSVRKLVARVE